MKRASSAENRRSRQALSAKQNHVQFSASCNQTWLEQSEFERIESLHIECHEIEHELKGLTMKMSDFLSKQVYWFSSLDFID